MRVLVTGGTGFAGRHLRQHLESLGHQVCHTSSQPGQSGPALYTLLLPSEERSLAVLEAVRPEAVVHLAAMAFPPDADREPARALAINLEGTVGLLGALGRHDPSGNVSFVFASTAQVYDARAREGSDEVLLSEESALWPQSTYAETKLAAELAVDVLLKAQGRPGVIFRPFNHAGPGQRPSLVLANFARQVALIEAKRAPPRLGTGNLDVRRDFSSVRDVVAAYALAAEGKVPPGTYNLCSGVATSLRQLVDMLQGMSKIPFEVEVRPEKLRPGEPITLRGSYQKIQSACGWAPKISLEATLREILDDWRKEVGNQKNV